MVLCLSLFCFQWDEALLTMSKGEKAQLEIEPEWAYGKKGQPDAKYPFTIHYWLLSQLGNPRRMMCFADRDKMGKQSLAAYSRLC